MAWSLNRKFEAEDQTRFAALSGDWNPIHVDSVAARRTPYGQIVHGVHALAWVLDGYLGEPGASVPSRVKVSFLKPIGLSEEVKVTRLEESGDVLFHVHRKSRILITIRATPSGRRFDAACAPVPAEVPRTPEARSFQEARGLEGRTEAWGDADGLKEAFPNLTGAIGTLRTAGILALSRLVGMVCPGLNSVFTGLDLSFQSADETAIQFKVVRHSIPNAPVRIACTGGGMEGSLDAIFRPSPARQMAMEDVLKQVRPDEFSRQSALVIGGSRGLGESIAKIIAAGGGSATVTYHVGEEDARRVADEITRLGGRCGTLRLDALEPEASLEALLASGTRLSHVYYFASPAIHANKGSGLDRSLFDSFSSYYVDAFDRICRVLAKAGRVRLFYPSTVFLEQAAPGFAEYVCAKAAGEALCGQLAREHANLDIVVERLPRMHTDQTNSFLEKKAADAHEVMLGIARKMDSREAVQWA